MTEKTSLVSSVLELTKGRNHSGVSQVVYAIRMLRCIRGEFGVPAFQAMKAVEVSVRDTARLGHGTI